MEVSGNYILWKHTVSGLRMTGRIIRREIMITDTISTIQQFVKNGGRYKKRQRTSMW